MKNKLILLLLLLSATTAYSIETARIHRFHSDIVIDTTGRIEVAETISVYADGDEIRRGIVRTLPIVRRNTFGKKEKVPVSILAIRRDGMDEPYTVEKAGDNIDVYIGDSDKLLTPGLYEYQIVYESYRHIGFFDEYDELYWNVTGNDWVFDILEASATITLPGGSEAISHACYTGYYKDDETECGAEVNGNQIVFKTTASLGSRQGLTVAVSFPRDIIRRPPPPTKAQLIWMQYKQEIMAAFIFLFMAIYYSVTWRRVGRDPEKPVVIPTFKPPHGWAPSVVRYLYKKHYDDKNLTVILLTMAIKGVLRITYKSKKYQLVPIGTRHVILSAKEYAVYNALFATKEAIEVDDANHARFSIASEMLKSRLKFGWRIKDYILYNIGYVLMAFLMLVILLFIYIKLGDGEADPFTMLFLLVMGIGFFIYVYLIKAPTILGAQTDSELKGFRMYLKTAEENRLNLLTPPDRTPELFEQMLPYAVALGVENEWSKKFNDVLSKANYQPDWYVSNRPFRMHGFANSFTNTFTSSVAEARVDPSVKSSGSSSWSGGSGGGGFSGGGGGGGGGRGW